MSARSVESPAFYPYLSGSGEPARARGDRRAASAGRVDEVLELVGLRERAGDKVSRYSLGMKQRLGIAGALLNDPQLLLLDEPANGLDPAGIVAMRETLRHLASIGKTVFVSSHLLAEVQQMADVVGIIAAGRLVREGPDGGAARRRGRRPRAGRPGRGRAAARGARRARRRRGTSRLAGEDGWLVGPDRRRSGRPR